MKSKIIVFVVTMLLLVACGDSEAAERREVPVQWATAIVQQDQSAMDSLLQEAFDSHDPTQGPQNDFQIDNYKLIEWKYDDETYFYEISYYNVRREVSTTHQMEVVRTSEGWKKTRYGDSKRFKELEDQLGEGEMLREMSQ
jgi:hypothetical protein